jgi:hypothetical protein
MPHFALVSDVRQESQNVIPDDFPDAEIEKEMDYAVSLIQGRIGSYDATNTRIDALKKIEILLASAFVLHHYKQFLELSQAKKTWAEEFLTAIEGSLTNIGDGGVDAEYKMTVTTYKSWPAAFLEDPDTPVRPYKSTNSFVY